MTGPRDYGASFAVPVNIETGRPLTEMQLKRMAAITDAVEPLYEAMHNAEGSAMPGEHQDHEFSTRRMKIAATHLETALLFARKAAME